jgi:hypothetical protein
VVSRKTSEQDPRFTYDTGGRQTGLNWEHIKRLQSKRSVVEDQVGRSKPKKTLSRKTTTPKKTLRRPTRRSSK